MSFNAKLTNTKQETHDSKTITLESKERPNFKPGQFFMIQFAGQKDVPKRAYSAASSPTKKNIVEFTIKEMPNGWVSCLLNKAKCGIEFLVDGPFGHFILEDNMKDVVMIGAGSGIAPFRGFCQYIIDKKLNTKVTLIYSNKTESDIILRNDFEEFAKQIKDMKLIFTLTREKKEGFREGRIDNALIKEMKERHKDAYFFLCGPPKMVQGTKELLFANGIPPERVKFEAYG